MSQFNLAFGFDWNSQSMLPLMPFAQLQLCLSETVSAAESRMASFYGELKVGDALEVSIVDITDATGLTLEMISAVVIFSSAGRAVGAPASPLESRYLSAAAAELEANRSLEDNQAYNVKNAPTWSLGTPQIVNQGTFAFSASITVFDPVTSALRTYVVDPEMEVGSGN